jgi:hypothetical protein
LLCAQRVTHALRHARPPVPVLFEEVLERLRVTADRESALLLFVRGQFTVNVVDDKGKRERVERGPQVVQHVTGDQGDVHRDGHIDVQPVGGPPWLVGRLRVNMLRILRPVCVADLRELVDVPGGVRQLQPPRGVKTKPIDRHDRERLRDQGHTLSCGSGRGHVRQAADDDAARSVARSSL